MLFSDLAAILILGYISAHVNPAMCLALLILGKINGLEFVAAVAGEFVGGFVGAVLVWLHYLPHFKTVPSPLSPNPENLLLRSGDPVSATALDISSYNVRPDDVAARKRGLSSVRLGNLMDEIQYYFKDTYRAEPTGSHSALMEVALGRDEVKIDKAEMANRLRRRSVQVCDVHRRLKDVDLEDFASMLTGSDSRPTPKITRSISEEQLRAPNEHNGLTGGTGQDGNGNLAGVFHNAIPARPNHRASATDAVISKRVEKLDKLYDAAVIADQNAKLSIFATRPAIYSPFFNFLCEFMSTTMLIYGALMIYARGGQLYGPESLLYKSEQGIWVGFFVFLCVISLGGPTGIAANPARDFSPRLAHFMLPIPGKGRSEFYYSWIPILAPFVGGCAAAGLYAATQLLNNSNVDTGSVFPAANG